MAGSRNSQAGLYVEGLEVESVLNKSGGSDASTGVVIKMFISGKLRSTVSGLGSVIIGSVLKDY